MSLEKPVTIELTDDLHLMVGIDLNKDGENVITLKVALKEVFDEAGYFIGKKPEVTPATPAV